MLSLKGFGYKKMNAKELIIKVAKEEQEKAIAELNEQLTLLENEERLPELCSALVNIFHNNLEQREVQIGLLKERLTNDFFKTSNIKANSNSIDFFSENFSVSFPTSRIRVIEVSFLNGVSMPTDNTNNTYITKNEKGAELLNAYLEKKSLKNLKSFVAWNSGSRYTDNIFGIIYKYYRNLKYHCNPKTLEQIKKSVEGAKEFERQDSEKMKIFNAEQVLANEFFESLTDLKQFEESGWKINCKRFMHNGKLVY